MAVLCLELSWVCWWLQQLGNGDLLMGQSDERGEKACPQSLYLFIICNVFMVLSPEEPWGLLCATTLTHGARPSGLPPLRPLLAAQAGAQRQALRVQVLPLNRNYLAGGCLLQAMVSLPERFPTSLPRARPTCSCTECPRGPDHLRFS